MTGFLEKKCGSQEKVLAKSDAAVCWCENASNYLLKHGGKQWQYLLIPHDEVKEQNNLENYVLKYSVNQTFQ